MQANPLYGFTFRKFRDSFPLFILPSIGATLCLLIGPKGILLLPIAFSRMIVASARVLELEREPRWWWWFKRLSQYWLVLLFVGALQILPSLLLLATIQIVGGVNPSDPVLDALSQLIIFIAPAILLLWRVWPLLAAAFLVEAKVFYKNPLHRYMLWPEGPAWLGPGIPTAWRWTGHPRVSALLSPSVAILSLFSFLLVLGAVALLSVSSLLGLVAFFLAFFLAFGPLALLVTAATWLTLLYNGERPLVPASDAIPLPDDSLKDTQNRLVEAVTVTYRFPQDFGKVIRYVLPNSLSENERNKLREEVRRIGVTQGRHEGSYLELWRSNADMRNDLPPQLLVDFQGDVVAVCIPEEGSELARAFEDLVTSWAERFPIIGLER